MAETVSKNVHPVPKCIVEDFIKRWKENYEALLKASKLP